MTIEHLYYSYETHYMQPQNLKTQFYTHLPKRHMWTELNLSLTEG